MIKWYRKAVFHLRTLSIAKIYGVSEYGALVPCDWTALYNAALLRCSPDAPQSLPPQYCSRQDNGPRLGTFTPRAALSGKVKHWMDCFLLLHFRIISNLAFCQQHLEGVLQASAHMASSSPRQVTGAHINGITAEMYADVTTVTVRSGS